MSPHLNVSPRPIVQGALWGYSTYLRLCSLTLDIFIKVRKRFFRCAYFLISEVANIIFTCYLRLSMLLNNQGAGEQKWVMYHEMSCNRVMHGCKELFYFTNFTEIKYSFFLFVFLFFGGGLYLTQVQFKLNTSLKYISNVSNFYFLPF